MPGMKKFTFYIVFWLFAMLVSVFSVQAKLFNGEEFFLDNGMQVIVIPNHKAPIVKHMVWYKAGSVDEAPGKGGSAHLLEHLMFRGTKKVPGNRFNEIMEENGAESNAFTSLDMTAYHQTVDVSRLELAMFLEADRMQNLKISDKDFELERDIVFQERKERVDNNPTAYFAEALRRTLWQEHPYGRPVSGTAEEIKALTKADVEDFYKRFYSPNNAILILAGDIDVGTAKKLAEKYYGPVKKRAKIERKKMPRLEESSRVVLEMSRPGIRGYRLGKSFAAPSYNFRPEDTFALSVLSAYMGDGDTSKLYKKLVLERGKALNVSTSYDDAARSYGTFMLSAIPASGVGVQELNQELDRAWVEAISEINDAEINKVKRKMLAGQVYLRDNPNDAAMIVGTGAVVGMSLAEIENQAEEIEKVTAADVLKAAKRLVGSSPVVTGILNPERGGADVTSSAL